MRRTELLQEIRKMRFTELIEAWQEGRLTQQEAAGGPSHRLCSCENRFIGEQFYHLSACPVFRGQLSRAVDRIQEREQLGGLVSIAEGGEGDHRPRGGMGVLAAVFQNAGRIALDVSGIGRTRAPLIAAPSKFTQWAEILLC